MNIWNLRAFELVKIVNSLKDKLSGKYKTDPSRKKIEVDQHKAKKTRKGCFSLLMHMSPRQIIRKSIIWPWGTRHTVSWLYTHIPNIIDISWKTKNVIVRKRKHYNKINYL